ncbi:L,D-transpeptidase family protein [Faunimonas pinastri]
MLVNVRSRPGRRGTGQLCCGNLVFDCALGKGGVTRIKREGDGATPSGRFRLLQLRVRGDRIVGPATRIPQQTLRPGDVWCDDPLDGRYNRPLRRAPASSHERMWREDGLYDLVGILNYNLRPRIRRAGSAIFLHIRRPEGKPTEGCVALERRALLRLLAVLGPNPEFAIDAAPRKRRARSDLRRSA